MNPLTIVLDGVRDGRHTLAEMAQASNSPLSVLEAARDHLLYTGQLVRSPLCPPTSCGGCPLSRTGCRPGLATLQLATQTS
ncbi:MAG: hypothetical protein LBR20_07750 [Propionibacteriaceae bacterium]|jgi:hypothetical protein|nr:hypothetical protein [Propionibacteriaceae bacterium]